MGGWEMGLHRVTLQLRDRGVEPWNRYTYRRWRQTTDISPLQQ